MKCDNCHELRSRIAEMERELGRRVTAGKWHALARGANVRPGFAKLLAALYDAGGMFVPSWDLLDVTAPAHGDDDRMVNNVSVAVWSIRKQLGRDAIESSRGQGYRLTPEGQAKVAAILRAVS